MAPEKERFSLKLPEDLLDELRAEAEAKGTSPTQLIEQALRDRKTAHESATMTNEQAIVKALRLCPECAVRYHAYAGAHPVGFVTKALRNYWWGILQVWPHGKYEDGCPGWEQSGDIDPAELRKYQDQLAEELLNTPSDRLGIR